MREKILQEINQSNVAIHCPTQEEADKLYELLGKKICSSRWISYKADTCFFYYDITYGDIYWVKENNYEILTAEYVLSALQTSPPKGQPIIANLQPGTKVRVRPDLRDDSTRYYMADKRESDVATVPMPLAAGKIVTVNGRYSSGKYSIEEVYGQWTDEMFSEIISLPDKEQAKPESVKPKCSPEPTTKPTQKDNFMTKLKNTALVTVDQNKEALIIASKMEAGRIINKQVLKQLSPHLPFFLQGYTKSPLAPIVAANLVAMVANHTQNQKLSKVSELMLLGAADSGVASFNLDKIVDDILTGIKLPKGVLDDEE